MYLKNKKKDNRNLPVWSLIAFTELNNKLLQKRNRKAKGVL